MVIMWPKKSSPTANEVWYLDDNGFIRSKLTDFCLQPSGTFYKCSFPSKPRLEVNICILTISFRQQLMAFSTIHAWLHSRSWDMASTIHEPTKPDVDPTGEQDSST